MLTPLWLSASVLLGAPDVEDPTAYDIDIKVREVPIDESGDDWDAYERELECARLQALAEAEAAEPKGLHWDGTYFAMGVAPATTLHATGFHPALRYDAELGMVWQEKRTTLAVGLEGRVMQYFGRKRPGGGADVVFTVGRGPFYTRAGVGVAAGVPRAQLLDEFRPVVGGVVGIGLQGGKDEFLGRVGLDYDVRFDDQYGVSHTVLVVARFAWGI
jgi:hypothetical protein